MHPQTFDNIYKKLHTFEDVKKIANRMDLPEELIFVIYTQKSTRKTTRDFYKVKNNIKKYHQQWKRGRSFVSLATHIHFPPTLMAMMVLMEDGVGRKHFWTLIRDLDNLEDIRLQKELSEVCEVDNIYSPRGMELQDERGRMGEKQLYDWLNDNGIGYKTEVDMRGKYPKTPDSYLDKPIKYKGKDVHWIESKAIFGDHKEVRRHVKKQLQPYVDLFGPGIVIYWFGYLNDIQPPENVFFEDYNFVKEFKPGNGQQG
jgi:hypothetical protein